MFFIIMICLVAKKGGRYLLPVFPVVNILAAIGLYNFVSLVMRKLPLTKPKLKNILISALFICMIALQMGLTLLVHPYYLSYYNPLVGGTSLAKKILNVGWGEGMDKAARYLNKKPNAKDLTVAVQYTAFKPYFLGKTVWMNNFKQADYLVFYISALQRGWHYSIWTVYEDKTPEHVVRINNIDYARIYRAEK